MQLSIEEDGGIVGAIIVISMDFTQCMLELMQLQGYDGGLLTSTV